MKRYCGSFLLLFAVIRSTSTRECSLSNDCGVIGGKTKLFCKVTAPFERRKLNWCGPGRDLITGGTILYPAVIDLEEASDGFYLTILNTTKDDSGTFICEYSFVQHDCIVTQEDFQALMCEQKVDGHKLIITITYRLQGYLPKISLMKSTGEAITGRFDSVIDNGFLKEIVWRSDDLSVGTYNYKVTGKCGFLTACSGTVDIAEGPTTSPSTVCQIGSDSVVMGGETKLFCNVTSAERPDRGGTKWVGPHGDLILRGVVVGDYIDIEMAIDGFYLIIKNTTKCHLGTYSCGYRTSPLSNCKLGLEHFQGTTVAPSEMKDWEIVLIVIFVMVVTFVPIVVLVYRFCFKNRTKDTKGCIARLSSYSCFQRFEMEHRTGEKYSFIPHEAVSGQDVTVTALEKDTASEISNEMSTSGHFSHTWSTSSSKSFETEHRTGEKYSFIPHEAVSGQDVTVTAVKDTASEKLVDNKDPSSQPIKLPPLEHTMATGNPDLETVDEIQTKIKKEKRRSKLTEEENKTEVPSDGEEQHENKILEMEERTGVNYFFSPREAVSGQDVTVTAVKKDTASEKTHEAGVDKNDICMKAEASENYAPIR